jgi:triosephosphate isomerase
MATKHLVIGNWKMNPALAEDAKRIAQKTRSVASNLSRTEVVACPPFAFIPLAAPRTSVKNFSLGSQSVSLDEGGAHTGEVGAVMLKSLGVEYVIAGHSEARAAGDTDGMVAKRIIRILESGLVAVVCVGEKVRDDAGSHFNFLREQIKNTFTGVPIEKAKNIVLAYEPVWAIGAKEAMAPEQVHEMSIFVKKSFADIFGAEAAMKVKVLYGGSVNSKNAADIMNIGQVDGLLVGRESVNMPGFTELLKAVDKI